MESNSNFNFIASAYDSLDIDTLKSMTNEIIDLYGYPCILTRYTGSKSTNHPLYRDRLTSTYNNDKLTKNNETRVFIENKHFIPQLMAYGYALNVETTVNAFMKLEDDVKPEDLVTLLYKHEAQRYTFQVNSASIWKSVCFNIVLSVYVRDDIKDTEIEENKEVSPLPIVTKKPRGRKRI